MPMLYLMGTLLCPMTVLWDPVCELIATHARGLSKDDFWKPFSHWLSVAGAKAGVILCLLPKKFKGIFLVCVCVCLTLCVTVCVCVLLCVVDCVCVTLCVLDSVCVCVTLCVFDCVCACMHTCIQACSHVHVYLCRYAS